MARTTIPASATDANSPGDQTLMDALRLNDEDHETRVITLEDSANIRVFSHFNKRIVDTGGSGAGMVICSGSASKYENFEGGFYFEIDGADGEWLNYIGNNGTDDHHFVRFRGTGAVNSVGVLAAGPAMLFTGRTKPIIFKTRVRASVNTNNMNAGLIEWGLTFAPNNGIYFQCDASNFRFRSVAGGTATNGSAITRISADTWFDIEIRFESSPGNQARCYLDGVLKETFVTNLPTTVKLYGQQQMETSALNETHDNDRMLVYASGPLADAA